MAVLRVIDSSWHGCTYNLLSRNCNHFSDLFCRLLGCGPCPAWIFGFLAHTQLTLPLSAAGTTLWTYAPVNGQPLAVEPEVNAAQSGATLLDGDDFLVAEERRGPDNVLFLRLVAGTAGPSILNPAWAHCAFHHVVQTHVPPQEVPLLAGNLRVAPWMQERPMINSEMGHPLSAMWRFKLRQPGLSIEPSACCLISENGRELFEVSIGLNACLRVRLEFHLFLEIFGSSLEEL